MSIVLKPLQAITNAPPVYDYGWMHTLVEDFAVDEKGNPCRLVENEDQWHFEQQILRYRSGLHLVITDQPQLDDFLQYGWLKLTDKPVVIHRFKVDLEEAFDWDDARREALVQCLSDWRNSPAVTYRVGSRSDYCFRCRGDAVAGQVRSQLAVFGLKVEPWRPSAGA